MQDEAYCCIPLWRRNNTVRAWALVDAADYSWLAAHRWHLNQVSNRPGLGYAVRRVIHDGRKSIIPMHRDILGLPIGDPRQGDHISRDKLDNRRANLRIVTHAQNMQNRPPHRGSASRFRGVYWDKRKSRWRARVRLDGKAYRLGGFRDEVEAGLVAEAWILEHMPFAEPDSGLAAAVAEREAA